MSESSSIHLIVNPAAGGGSGFRTGRLAHRILADRTADIVYCETSSPDDLTAQISRAVDARASVIAVVGGDGTVQQAVQLLAGTEIALGLVPCGRGNDLARALNVPFATELAIDLIARGERRTIDLGSIAGRRFATVATFGFDAAVAELIHRREVPGSGLVAYGLAILKGLVSYRCTEAKLEGDFGTIEGKFFLVATANTRYYGAGMEIAPSARPDDGLLDVCVVGEVGKLDVVRMLPRVVKGDHESHWAVTMLRTRKLTIDSPGVTAIYADGEPMPAAPTTVTVEDRALTVIAPPAP